MDPPPYSSDTKTPDLPPRTGENAASNNNLQAYPPPPQRAGSRAGSLDGDDPSSAIHYTRDPHKLVAYLVPFPKPMLRGVAPDALPTRFMIYTPPPPPLKAPKEGEKEDKLHKVQRKWQEEVREAKTNPAKIKSWKGVKGRVTKGVDHLMGKTTSSSIDFLGRMSGSADDKHADDGHDEGDETKKTVGLEELVLVYPTTMNMTPDQLRQEFVETMMRNKTKAQRDAVLATGLIPVAAAIDILATLIWPFGGLLEIDSVWAYSSIRGAKTSRSVTKRLNSSGATGNHDEDTLKLKFVSSPRLEVLDKYLAARCHERDSKAFPYTGAAPTESTALEAIGWSPSQTGGEEKNWEDEQWEITEVKEDLKNTMGKGAKEWDKWCLAYEKDPEKALKK